jgi:N utilization substance protein A
LGEGLIEKLNAAGVTSVEALADMTPEQLEAIEGIGPKTVEKISLAVNNFFGSLEVAEPAVEPAAVETAPQAAEGQEAAVEEPALAQPAADETIEAASAIEAAPEPEVPAEEAVEEPASSEAKDEL